MTRPRLNTKTLRAGGLIAAAAVVLSAVIPAWGQVAPPSREHNDQSDQDSHTPNYVDNRDYDPQPYYVDGVQYKPYVAKKGAKATANDAAKPAATKVSQQTSTDDQSYDPSELHPFVPQHSASSSSTVSSSTPKVVAQASSHSAKSSDDTSSASNYVPQKRTRYASAIIEALDKVTAESVRFEAPINQPVRYKGLIYVVRACETTAPDEPAPDVVAYMQVRTSPQAATNTSAEIHSKEIFHGWTFASAPSLNPIQHPVYDAWVIGCRKPLPGQTG